MDESGLWQTVNEHRISMCGYGPATAMLAAVKALGANHAELVQYSTSGDVSRDYDQVVGYAGMIFY
jgi:AmmeMemoRadiSam system protein B